jgi:hypothetical protein
MGVQWGEGGAEGTVCNTQHHGCNMGRGVQQEGLLTPLTFQNSGRKTHCGYMLRSPLPVPNTLPPPPLHAPPHPPPSFLTWPRLTFFRASAAV